MKRILALDGGGIRGVFSLQILARIEHLFRENLNRPDLVLADVFDLIAGTSTGAIIATFLSWGLPVREIERLYVERAREMFAREHWWLYRRWFKAKYRSDLIENFFRTTFSDPADGGEPARLGSKCLRTLLLIVVRNASTGSPWPVTNNPHAQFAVPALPDCNLQIPLWRLLRASTAAPWYFPPEEIQLGENNYMFIDGGMTPYNNPALIAVRMATLPCYRLCWPASRESLHVISLGTGGTRARLPEKLAKKIHLLDQLKYLAPALMGSFAEEQDYLCRILGDCLYGAPINREIGALDGPTLFDAHEQKFTYVRYDHPFQPNDKSGKPRNEEAKLDDVNLIPLLQAAGREYAKQVCLEHFFPRNPAGASPAPDQKHNS